MSAPPARRDRRGGTRTRLRLTTSADARDDEMFLPDDTAGTAIVEAPVDAERRRRREAVESIEVLDRIVAEVEDELRIAVREAMANLSAVMSPDSDGEPVVVSLAEYRRSKRHGAVPHRLTAPRGGPVVILPFASPPDPDGDDVRHRLRDLMAECLALYRSSD